MSSISGWFKPSESVARCWIRSECHAFPCHFVPVLGKSVRCLGQGCELCDLLPLLRHQIICLQVGQTRELKIFELREHHAETIVAALELGPEAIGRPIWLWVDTSEHGNPFQASIDRPEFVPKTQGSSKLDLKAVPCAKYISKIGTREYWQAISLRLAIIAQIESTATHATASS